MCPQQSHMYKPGTRPLSHRGTRGQTNYRKHRPREKRRSPQLLSIWGAARHGPAPGVRERALRGPHTGEAGIGPVQQHSKHP